MHGQNHIKYVWVSCLEILKCIIVFYQIQNPVSSVSLFCFRFKIAVINMKQDEAFVKVCTEMLPCAGRYGTEKQEIFLQQEHKPRKIFVSILFDEVLYSCSNLLCWRFIKKCHIWREMELYLSLISWILENILLSVTWKKKSVFQKQLLEQRSKVKIYYI